MYEAALLARLFLLMIDYGSFLSILCEGLPIDLMFDADAMLDALPDA
jgi:hypothetical protein